MVCLRSSTLTDLLRAVPESISRKIPRDLAVTGPDPSKGGSTNDSMMVSFCYWVCIINDHDGLNRPYLNAVSFTIHVPIFIVFCCY